MRSEDKKMTLQTNAHETFAEIAAPEYHVHTFHIGDSHLISVASPKAIGEVRVWDAGGM